MERRFQTVMVDEPSVEETIEILKGIKGYYESYHRVKITDDIIRTATVLAERYIQDRYLPDKAIDVIDEAASRVNLNNTELIQLDEMRGRLCEIQKEKDEAAEDNDYQRAADLRVRELRLEEEIEEIEASSVKSVSYTHLDPSAGEKPRWRAYGLPHNRYKNNFGFGTGS